MSALADQVYNAIPFYDTAHWIDLADGSHPRCCVPVHIDTGFTIRDKTAALAALRAIDDETAAAALADYVPPASRPDREVNDWRILDLTTTLHVWGWGERLTRVRVEIAGAYSDILLPHSFAALEAIWPHLEPVTTYDPPTIVFGSGREGDSPLFAVIQTVTGFDVQPVREHRSYEIGG